METVVGRSFTTVVALVLALSATTPGQAAAMPDRGADLARHLTTAPAEAAAGVGITAVSAGGSHTCALRNDGVVLCWGDNRWGQIGDGTTVNRRSPVVVPGVTTAVAVAAGLSHTCALLADHTVKCWGARYANGTGTDTLTPVRVAGITTATQVSAGGGATCVLMVEHTVQCWGLNEYGQLGNGTGGTWGARSVTPVKVSGVTTAEAIAVGLTGACALLGDRTVRCWGTGVLGDGRTTHESCGTTDDAWDCSRTPVQVAEITPAAEVSISWNHACARLDDGSVRCWGNNGYTQLGDGGLAGDSSPYPVLVAGIADVVAVRAGYNFTCALRSGGTVTCWGGNDGGELGDGTSASMYAPVAVEGVAGAIAITAGGHACARLAEGATWCWGGDRSGQLGLGGSVGGSRPALVKGLGPATAVGAGGSHSCAVLLDGTVACWGRNNNGQLGDGSLYDRATPSIVAGIDSVAAVSTGEFGACALMANHTVWCWGWNASSQLGDDLSHEPCDRLEDCSPRPVQVEGITTAVGVSTGDDFACAVLTDGTVVCWGCNMYGQLGDGTPYLKPVPTVVRGVTSAIAVSAGYSHACALLHDGGVRCWGRNENGELGDGTLVNRNTPVAPVGLPAAKAVAAGGWHSCALLRDGTVRCWGMNARGELGDDTTTRRTRPVAAVGTSGVISLAAGDGRTCAVTTSGSVRCWGRLVSGGSATVYPTAVAISGITGVAGVAAGGGHVCAVVSGASVSCWGDNSNGQVGDGTTATTGHAVRTLFPPRPAITATSATTMGAGIALAWSATLTLTPVASYDVRVRRAPWNGTFGASEFWQSGTTASGGTFPARAGFTYCFAVRGRAADAALSGWSGETCTTTPLDERSLRIRSGWTKGTGSAYYRGTFVRARTLGSTLTRTGVVARKVAVVVQTCPTCGTIGVYWNGTLVKRVSLRSATVRNRRVITVLAFGSVRTGTLKLRVLSSGRKVVVDGIAIRGI